MIFYNPKGAPELACEQCGCRWFDRMTDCCYECGTPISEQAIAEFDQVLQAFAAGSTSTTVRTFDAPGKTPARSRDFVSKRPQEIDEE